MPYIPHTDADIQAMLAAINVETIDDLFDEIPQELRSGKLDNVPDGISEMALSRLMAERAEMDAGYRCFIGAGAYEHHIPAAVWELATRGEFYTAYTPYQAEASQGTLQLVYEYQSMIANLNNMDVSNASMYDGATAMAEAVLMAIRANRKSKSKRVLVAGSINPYYVKATNVIVKNQNIELVEVKYNSETGQISKQDLALFEGEDFAAMIIAQPNFFGVLENVDEITDWVHQHGGLMISLVNPISLALLKAPGDWGQKGADISVGDGQPLGIPLSSGGPYLGFMCCKQEYVRQIPGRIIGRTIDSDGKEGFTLTLQAREQHIRRSKATSNICTNQGLAATAAAIHMSLMGAAGLKEVAKLCHLNTQMLIDKMTAIDGVDLVFSGSVFHEFVVKVTPPSGRTLDEVMAELTKRKILCGYELENEFSSLENCLLLCVTETKNESDLDLLCQTLESVLA